jgi:hypothetical protein
MNTNLLLFHALLIAGAFTSALIGLTLLFYLRERISRHVSKSSPVSPRDWTKRSSPVSAHRYLTPDLPGRTPSPNSLWMSNT